jgi:hypothetical protein
MPAGPEGGAGAFKGLSSYLVREPGYSVASIVCEANVIFLNTPLKKSVGGSPDVAANGVFT